MDKDYRIYHNKLMHSNGTTAFETFLGIVPSFAYEYIGTTLASIFLSFVTKQKIWLFLFEFSIIIIPTLLHLSILSNYMKELFFSAIVLIISLTLLINNFPKLKKPTPKTDNRVSSITNFRAAVNLSSVICILAVDFHIFPRRLAKTVTYGYSLMDVGVGYFMIANGLVAPEIRGKYDTIKTSIKSSIPLFILGGIRFFITTETDYVVPVSEYGVHWNFFITLAVTKIFTSLIMNVIKVPYIYINAIALLVAHETLLQAGLASFALSDRKRDNFITANKEGLVSSMGYVSLYLFSVYFGYWLDIKKALDNKKKTLIKIFGLSLLLFIVTVVLHHSFGVSRRLANSGYCMWMLFISMFTLGLLFLGEMVQEYVFGYKLSTYIYSPYIFEAINYNGLPFFLVSNVLTGLVNFCFYTLKLGDASSFVILSGYMLINCLVVCILYEKQIKLKL